MDAVGTTGFIAVRDVGVSGVLVWSARCPRGFFQTRITKRIRGVWCKLFHRRRANSIEEVVFDVYHNACVFLMNQICGNFAGLAKVIDP